MPRRHHLLLVAHADFLVVTSNLPRTWPPRAARRPAFRHNSAACADVAVAINIIAAPLSFGAAIYRRLAMSTVRQKRRRYREADALERER